MPAAHFKYDETEATKKMCSLATTTKKTPVRWKHIKNQRKTFKKNSFHYRQSSDDPSDLS